MKDIIINNKSCKHFNKDVSWVQTLGQSIELDIINHVDFQPDHPHPQSLLKVLTNLSD